MDRKEAIEEIEILNQQIQALARRRQAILQAFGRTKIKKQPNYYFQTKKATKRFPKGRTTAYYS